MAVFFLTLFFMVKIEDLFSITFVIFHRFSLEIEWNSTKNNKLVLTNLQPVPNHTKCLLSLLGLYTCGSLAISLGSSVQTPPYRGLLCPLNLNVSPLIFFNSVSFLFWNDILPNRIFICLFISIPNSRRGERPCPASSLDVSPVPPN